MTLLLVIVLFVLSLVISLALGLGSMGASIIYMLLVTLVALISTGRQNDDTPKLPDDHDERLTD